MSLESTLREISDGLKSVRATERKKNAESLKEFLSRNALPSLLTENTLQKKGFSWNYVFDDIHEYILKETEKFETSKTFDNVIAPLCTSLLHLCVAGSNKGQAYIKCDKITEAALYILKDSRLKRAIGDAYLNLLYKYVMPYDHYLGFITPVTWEELLDSSLSACMSNNYFKLDDYTKLRLVLLIMKNATNNCQLVVPLRDSLSKLTKCFLKVAYEKKAQEVVVEIMILLLDKLSSECRLTMCHFTENMLSTIFKFYDHTMDIKKKAMLFELLHGVVILHHPQGRLQTEEGSLAHDWDVWNKQLHNILEVVCLEISSLQKVRKPTDDWLKQANYFCRLAAAAYFQIFANLDRKENDVANVTKKQRISFNKNKSFNDLIGELQQNPMPWLGVVYAYVVNYGLSISTYDYFLLINTVQVMVVSTWPIDGNAAEEFATLVVKNLLSQQASERNDECYKLLISLWDVCVRNSTSKNNYHNALHTIMQILLTFHIPKYTNVQPLLKLYLDKGMPVTDASVKTLCKLFKAFFSKCSHEDVRINCLNWFIQDVISIDSSLFKELILRLISKQNINYDIKVNPNLENNSLYNTLYNSNEDSILFSEFEKNTPTETIPVSNISEHVEVNAHIDEQVMQFFIQMTIEQNEKIKNKSVGVTDYIRFVRIILAYLDLTIKYKVINEDKTKTMELYQLLKTALSLMYDEIRKFLETDGSISQKVMILHALRDIMLMGYHSTLNVELRTRIEKNMFKCLNNIIIKEVNLEEDVVCQEDDEEVNASTLKHLCFVVLAGYCRKIVAYRNELLELILDPKIFNFNTDTQCALQCIEILQDTSVEEPPLEMVFTLMQYMCRDLYRDSKVTYGILRNLIPMLDRIWAKDGMMKQNCFIMVKSYLQRCEKSHYPPHVTACLYECIAKVAALNRKHKQNQDSYFEEALINKIKGEIHSVRIYCCYLLKLIDNYADDDTDILITGLSSIFLVNVAERKEHVLKDESANRTLTVFHYFLALIETNKSLVQKIIIEVLNLQKEYSVNRILVRKVLNKICTTVDIKDFETYMNDNILSILHFWFLKNYSIDDLPFYLMGCDSPDAFIERHKKWLISADILWRRGGNVRDTEVLKLINVQSGQTLENIVEMCFGNIMVLCLPYIVVDKYNLNYTGSEKPSTFKKSMSNAKRMFQITGTMLENDKWSNLFVENVGGLVKLTATHIADSKDASEVFQIKIPEQTKTYYYPKHVFSSILDYFGELTEGNIMQYLCENQPLSILKVVFELWKNVIQENILEFRALALHAYITFLQNVPLGFASDAFTCNLACHNFAHAIKICQDADHCKLFVRGLKIVLDRFLPENVNELKKSISQLLPVLVIKKEEGSDKECADLLDDLVVDMQECLKENEDVIDFVRSLSQRVVDNMSCSTMTEFEDKLQMYKNNLACVSTETLVNLRTFLKANDVYVHLLVNAQNSRRFSEDCERSVLHQLINSLNNILKSCHYDENTVIAACNCLSHIGTYDLKTLVTVPPPNTQKIGDMNPKQYFASMMVTSLSEVLFDEDPRVSCIVAETLSCLLKYREGSDALDMENVDKNVLKPLSTANANVPLDIKINNKTFDEYCSECNEGIFAQTLAFHWTISSEKKHSDWLKVVTEKFLSLIDFSANFSATLREVCLQKASVCKHILPALVGLLLRSSSEKHIQTLSEHVNKVFEYVWEQSFGKSIRNSDSSGSSKTSEVLDYHQKLVIQYMLDIVDVVRMQAGKKHYKTRGNALNYLRLEYDKVAWAATIADQNLAAIYYGELWATAQNNGVPPSSPENTTNIEHGENIQKILRKCYVSIGEMDAIDGCGTAHLTIEDEKRRHLINTGQFSDALLLNDIALSCGSSADLGLQCEVVRSLHKSGMYHLALQYIKSLPEDDALNDVKYECLSVLGDWNNFVDTSDLEEKSKALNCNTNSIIKAFRYACLKDCLNIQATGDFESKLILPLNRAKVAVSKLCQNFNMENCQSVYKIVAKLHLFSDIEDYFAVRANKLATQDLLDRWEVNKLPPYNDFKHLEEVISQRVLILEHAATSNAGLLNDVVSLQIDYAKLGLSNNRIQMAQRLLAVVKKLKSSDEVALVESEISWAKGHKDIALSLLRNIVSKQSTEVKHTALSLRQYALWMAESKRDNARDIINKYLLKSLEVLKRGDDVKTRLKVYYDIARFADAEYNQVVAYMSSSIFENKVKCMESMKGTASSLRSTQQNLLTKDERKALYTNERFKDLDEAEIANTKAERDYFLQLAMRYYLLSLKQCDENNLSIFRVISLWLDNPSFEFENREAYKFEDLLHAIPSWKFVTVLPQLAPRLTSENNDFAKNLRKIIRRCAVDHPHHTFPILFSLKNSDKDKQILNSSGRSPKPRGSEPRVVAAEALVQQLAGLNDVMGEIVAQMEKICDATISFANYKPKTKEIRQKIPTAEKIHTLTRLHAIPLPTVVVPVRPDCKYEHFPSLMSFEKHFELVGGINCPKKICCTDSNGRKRILLIKGEDDMRQDAVMQQVFTIVNTLLENNPVTNRNNLLIRTYKVVPMSRQSGVLEWCEGTVPLGVYLNTAHAQYRPQDITCSAARKKLADAHEARKSNNDKLRVFLNILKEFKPVFHYFFTEHYLDPVTWYERRLAYTKSVATSSMVGYILGLGDRHVQNILVDKKTAEVVHIDFGIAFDQGKTLHTPETVPFRLTQDIVAGFGSSGVEGIFRRSCEKTMLLLRDNQETLLTILKVLLCDPLCTWTVTAAHQNAGRDVSVCGQSGSNSGLAERALLAVSSKLSGTEGGVAGGVAVPGQVARLLQAAANPGNLSRLFPGWQPYM